MILVLVVQERNIRTVVEGMHKIRSFGKTYWKGCDRLIDLQEVKTKLEDLDGKLKQIGDSLWHC